ncbi:hypothetical protein, partial [uncultured Parasutterella sp.]|uniref:hypothetical protein n=1 Tax=uncultured Parasutterella sp. TaxID=1263098 RepID=UPI00272DA9E4
SKEDVSKSVLSKLTSIGVFGVAADGITGTNLKRFAGCRHASIPLLHLLSSRCRHDYFSSLSEKTPRISHKYTLPALQKLCAFCLGLSRPFPSNSQCAQKNFAFCSKTTAGRHPSLGAFPHLAC